MAKKNKVNKYSENNTVKYYDIIYKKWIKKDYTNYELDLIKKYLSKDGKLLDVGCGSGRHSKPLHEEGYYVEGIEPLEEFVNKLKSKVPSLKVFKGYFREYKSNNKFDVIICMWNAFHQLAMTIDEALWALNRMKKLLNPNGTIIFSLTPGERFKIDDYDFTHEEIINGIRYHLDWKVLSYDRSTKTVTSLENIKVYDKNGKLIDDAKAHVKQRYWNEKDLLNFAKKLSLKVKITPPFPGSFDNHYIFTK